MGCLCHQAVLLSSWPCPFFSRVEGGFDLEEVFTSHGRTLGLHTFTSGVLRKEQET